MIARTLINRSQHLARRSIIIPSLPSNSRIIQNPRPTCLSIPRPNYAFSTSIVSRSAGQTDSELVGKLEAEVGYETETGSTDEPDWLKAFKADNTFSIEDNSGSDEVGLTRTFGNEKIRILFSCSDIEQMDDEEEMELELEEADKDRMPSSTVRTSISIVKPGKGGMVIDANTVGDSFEIDNVSFYDDENVIEKDTTENDWKRRGMYIGPRFVELDEELQQAFNRYLDERGIGSELALVVANFAEYKEQKEYVSWLSKMGKFIKA